MKEMFSKHSKHRKPGPMILVLLMIFSCSLALADELSMRFQSVEKLLEESSAARQIEDSGNPLALAKQAEARAHYAKARQASEEGDEEMAGAELSLATKVMLDAVRLADQENVVHDKKITDFSNRESAINALLEAHGRMTQEIGKVAEGRELHQLVVRNLEKARGMLEQGRVDEGRQLLDETYIVTKTAIDAIRGGETLVRSLTFASEQEEYKYELDRNDTHLMLVRVLLDEKMKDTRISEQVQPVLDEAATLRKRAEQEAGRGEFAVAIATLEESTRQVTRAIRMAGIYIPG